MIIKNYHNNRVNKPGGYKSRQNIIKPVIIITKIKIN